MGVDAASAYCYLLKAVEYRDEDTWGYHLLDVKTKRREAGLVARVQDIKTLLQWFSYDVLVLAGPPLAVRQELFNFIACELQNREGKQYPTISKLRKALHNQRDHLLAFASVLDQKLAAIAIRFELSIQAVRDVCLLHRKQPTPNAYWER